MPLEKKSIFFPDPPDRPLENSMGQFGVGGAKFRTIGRCGDIFVIWAWGQSGVGGAKSRTMGRWGDKRKDEHCGCIKCLNWSISPGNYKILDTTATTNCLFPDAYWAGVVDAVGWVSATEIRVPFPTRSLLRWFQGDIGGTLSMISGERGFMLRFRGGALALVRPRIDAARNPSDPEYARGFLTAGISITPTRLRVSRKKQPDTTAAIAETLRAHTAFQGITISSTPPGTITFNRKKQHAQVLDWLWYPDEHADLHEPRTQDLNEQASDRTLGAINHVRHEENRPQRHPFLTDAQKASIRHLCTHQLSYKLIATRVGCSERQVKYLVKKERLRDNVTNA